MQSPPIPQPTSKASSRRAPNENERTKRDSRFSQHLLTSKRRPNKGDVQDKRAVLSDQGQERRRGAPSIESEPRNNEIFSPVPSVLLQPATAPTAADATTVGSGAERAQAAALAERLVESIRVTDLGKERFEVKVRIMGIAGRGGIDVELHQDRGELSAVLKPDANAIEDADRLVQAFEREAAARGLQLETIEIER